MKGIILAGGAGTRLYPITKIINKHLLPVYKKPMILYPLETLIKAGIKEIMIVTNPQDLASFNKLLGYGEEYGIKITYTTQINPGGIAEALSLASGFCQEKKCVVMLGDNIIFKNINKAVEKFQKQGKGAKILLTKVKNTKPYGIAKIENKKLLEIIEKPEIAPSNLAVTGIYFYDSQVFEVIKSIQPSNRNELEITSVNNFYIQQNTMNYELLKGQWIDAGESFDNLYLASKMVRKFFYNLK